VTLRTVVVDDEPLARQRVVDLVRGRPELTLVGEAEDGRTALDLIAELRPDLVFLDIQMPELNGFEVISALDDDDAMPRFVFITAFDEYAVRAFEVDAMDYLLKPVTKDRFNAAVSRVLARSPNTEANRPMRTLAERATETRPERPTRFVARRGTRHYFVRVSDIDWIEAVGNYVRLQTGESSHLIRETMRGLETKLDPVQFVRMHRSAIVAIDRIDGIQARDAGDYLVTLRDGTRLVSSRVYSERIRALLR
jgi:two-component system, LytTR family, response regulator